MKLTCNCITKYVEINKGDKMNLIHTAAFPHILGIVDYISFFNQTIIGLTFADLGQPRRPRADAGRIRQFNRKWNGGRRRDAIAVQHNPRRAL